MATELVIELEDNVEELRITHPDLQRAFAKSKERVAQNANHVAATFDLQISKMINDSIDLMFNIKQNSASSDIPYITPSLKAKVRRIAELETVMHPEWLRQTFTVFYELCITIVRMFPKGEFEQPVHGQVTILADFAEQDDDLCNRLNKVAEEADLRMTVLEWTRDLKEKEQKFERLMKFIDEQKAGLNFVLLNKAFLNMRRKKKVQLKAEGRACMYFGFAMCLPIVLQAVYFQYKDAPLDPKMLLISIPAVSLTLILLYFFRISLRSVESIKSQILQLQLREAICQFVQGYAEYAGPLQEKQSRLLEKFETLVFSNVVATDEKIPSTFDGMDQLAGLIKAVQGK